MTFLRRAAGLGSRSPLLRRARALWDQNQAAWDLPLTRFQKFAVGVYLILRDYHAGVFPPRHDDRERVYAGELNYTSSLPGVTSEDALDAGMRKPWWFGRLLRKHLMDFCDVHDAFSEHGIVPGMKILELGCGSGWMAEQLTIMGYDVTGTSLDPQDINLGQRRIDSLKAKGLSCALQYRVAAMENVSESVHDQAPFDAVLVYEALHHAYSWQEAIASAARCLKPGGTLFLFKEPGVLHTLIAYRVALLSNTHEIGFKRDEVRHHLKSLGFSPVTFMPQKRGSPFLAFSLAARLEMRPKQQDQRG